MNPTTAPDAIPTLDMIQLTSATGVMLATTFIVGLIKRLVGDKPFFKDVPIFIYVTLVAMLVTVFANKVLGTLTGSLGYLLWESVKLALASSGFYVWLVRGQAITPTGETQGAGVFSMLFLTSALSLFAVGAGGCASLDELSVKADESRYAAVQGVILEHSDRHPDQAQTWADFLRTWERSIAARKNWSNGVFGPPSTVGAWPSITIEPPATQAN